jgi:O-antigen/teichoic acid export membrane protein
MNSVSSVGFPAIRRRLARDAADPLLRSAYSLMLNVVLTSTLGFGFWIVAARMFPAQIVGRDSALIASMITISVICQLNLASGILRFLPISRVSASRVVLGSYAVTALVSAAGGAAFVLVAPALANGYRFLGRDAALSALYVAAVTVWGVFALQDSVLTALRRAPWVPVENATFGVMKIAALPVLLAVGSLHAVFTAWIIPMVILVIPVNFLIFTRVMPNRARPASEQSPIERFGRVGLAGFMAQDYLATVLIQATGTLLPVIVVALLGSSDGAYFYIPFTIVSAFDLLFVNVAASLVVEGSMSNTRLAMLARRTVQRFRYVLLAGTVVLFAGAHLILMPFGSAYANAGAQTLRLLVCASMFRATIALYGAICRVEGNASRVLAVQAAAFALTIGLTILLGRRGGLQGIALAWLIANALVACAVAPRLLGILAQGSAGRRP